MIFIDFTIRNDKIKSERAVIMKLKEKYVLKMVADSWVILELDSESVNLNEMMLLNESGAMLWTLLKDGADTEELVDALVEEYDIPKEQALADINVFYEKLVKKGFAEEI